MNTKKWNFMCKNGLFYQVPSTPPAITTFFIFSISKKGSIVHIKSYKKGLEADGWRELEPESRIYTQKMAFFVIGKVQITSSLPIFPDIFNLHIKNWKKAVFLIEKHPISGLLAFLLARSCVYSAPRELSGAPITALLSAPLEPATLRNIANNDLWMGVLLLTCVRKERYPRGRRFLVQDRSNEQWVMSRKSGAREVIIADPYSNTAPEKQHVDENNEPVSDFMCRGRGGVHFLLNLLEEEMPSKKYTSGKILA